MPETENPRENGQEDESPRAGRFRMTANWAKANWKPIAAAGIWTTAIAGASAVVTLVLTHNSAVAENATAYSNGLLDGLKASREHYFSGFEDGFDEALDEALDFSDWYVD